MKFVSKVVDKNAALSLAQVCISHSAFVEVMPLPDDLYEVSVKRENESFLNDKFLVITRKKGLRIEPGIVYGITMTGAINKVRAGAYRACYVGTHNASNTLEPDQVEHVDIVGEEGESGFIIRPYHGAVVSYIGEEWVNGDIVDTIDGSYGAVRRWISDNHAGHWRRRYSLEDLIWLWNEFGKVGKNAAGVLTTEPFMFFPEGANVYDVKRLFEEVDPLFVPEVLPDVIPADHPLWKLVGAGAGSSEQIADICSSCENEVGELIGCPDGAEVCSSCFNAGSH